MSIYETTSTFLDSQRRSIFAQAWAENSEYNGPHYERCWDCGETFDVDNGEIYPAEVECADCTVQTGWLCEDCG